jgi:putative membrane protein
MRVPAWTAYLVILGVGAALWWGSLYHPAAMPVWGPWQFSWAWYLTAAFALWWYFHGLSLLPADERPAPWRSAFYLAGVLAIYTVLQTHFDYLAQHMFFLNRVQHVVMHHLGPFVIALAWPGVALYRGMPPIARSVVNWRGWYYPVRIIQQPVIAPIIFVGLVGLWLIPAVHFRAMVDPKLYQLMNWSMVVDGLFFWILVLDPRPKPPALASYAGRIGMAFVVMPPQILFGALLAFTDHDVYHFYTWCGRIYPAIGALQDQHLGGLNVWIPPSMMSVIAFVLVINNLRLHEERLERERGEDDDDNDYITAAWTGR